MRAKVDLSEPGTLAQTYVAVYDNSRLEQISQSLLKLTK